MVVATHGDRHHATVAIPAVIATVAEAPAVEKIASVETSE
jgi:hypothetical protein